MSNIVGSGFLRHRPSSRYCCYENHAAGSKPNQTLLLIELRMEWGLSMPKVINTRCELVKLCHINRSGPVFLDTV